MGYLVSFLIVGLFNGALALLTQQDRRAAASA
jgi:hypothetical protein